MFRSVERSGRQSAGHRFVARIRVHHSQPLIGNREPYRTLLQGLEQDPESFIRLLRLDHVVVRLIDAFQAVEDALLETLQDSVQASGITDLLVVEDADRAELLAEGPGERQTEVGDHAEPDIRIATPRRVRHRIGDHQFALGVHHVLTIEAGIERVGRTRAVDVALASTCDQDLDLLRMHAHDQRRRRRKELGQQIDGVLPRAEQGIGNLQIVEDRIFGIGHLPGTIMRSQTDRNPGPRSVPELNRIRAAHTAPCRAPTCAQPEGHPVQVL